MRYVYFSLVFIAVAAAVFGVPPPPPDEPKLLLEKVSPHVWVHTSFEIMTGQAIDSHGLVIDTPDGLVLVDTCWNSWQTGFLLLRLTRELKKPVVLAVVTHAHADRIGGLWTLLGRKIKVVSTPLTAKKAVSAGYPAPAAELDPVFTRLVFGGVTVEVFFPGPGHTEDNMTVYVPGDRVLFGACLVKSLGSKNLGNTTDAVVGEWAASVGKLMKRYPDAEVVVPGHGPWGGKELLEHTLRLAGGK